MAYDYDLCIIGAGPGGYVGAIKAAQLGLKVAIFEKKAVGGVCLNIGCIPSKSLISQAKLFASIPSLENMGLQIDRKGFSYQHCHDKAQAAVKQLTMGVKGLLKKNKVALVEAEAKLQDGHTIIANGKHYLTRFVLLATGSSFRELEQLPVDEQTILSSTGALALGELPSSVVIVGAGIIGLEFAYIWHSFGVSVTLVEKSPQFLPQFDKAVTKELKKILENKGITFHLGTDILSVKKDKNITIAIESQKKEQKIVCDKILVSVGRSPNTQDFKHLNLKLDQGFFLVEDYYRTNHPSIYAIGDAKAGSPMLAHVASAEAEIAVEHIKSSIDPSYKLTCPRKIEVSNIPSASYFEPQLGTFGLTEEQAQEQKIAYKTIVFPFIAVGKAIATEKTSGFLKLVFDKNTHEILGAHALGDSATEIIHELLLAKNAELLLEDVEKVIHAHPTLAEINGEAVKMALGHPIHY